MSAAAAPSAPDDATLVTLRDLVAVTAWGLRVVAVPAAIDREVRWAHSTELLDPRPYLSGGELVLTVGTSLRGDEQCRDFVTHLVDAQVSALGYGVGDVTDAIPEPLVEACRERSMPLLQVPEGVPFQAITELLADRRVEAGTARSRRVQQLTTRLLDAVAADQPLDALLDVAAADLGGTLAYVDGAVRWTAVSGSDVAPSADTLRHVGAVLAVRQHEVDVDAGNRRRETGRLLRLVLDGRADAEVLADALDAARSGARGPVCVAAWPERAADLVVPRLPGVLLADLAEVTVTVGRDADVVLALADELALPCGVVSRVGVGDLAQAVPTAMQALELSRRRGSAVTEHDLVSFEGLLEAQDPERLRPFAEALLLPLLEHDRDHGTALVATLRAYLDGDGSVSTTARALFLHPNSLRHRLRRIAELTGCEPRLFKDRTALAVGLWAWDRRPRTSR